MRRAVIFSLVLAFALLLLLLSGCSTGKVDGIEYEIIDDSYAVVTGAELKLEAAEILSEFKGCPVKVIGERAFFMCAVKELVIPESVERIEKEAFSSSALEKITLPEGVSFIGERAFARCNLSEIVIPDGVNTISAGTFDSCYLLKSVTLPENLKQIGEKAFYWCLLLENVNFPDGLESIGEGAFFNCVALTELVLPESVTAIEKDAFAQCHGLEKITLPSSFAEIPDSVFTNTKYDGNRIATLDDEENETVEETAPEEEENEVHVYLWDAVRDGAVKLTPIAQSIDSFTLDIENVSEGGIYLDISHHEQGYYLASPSDDTQNMLITHIQYSSNELYLAQGESYGLSVDTACMNIHRDIPSSGSSGYVLTALEENSLIAKLAAVLYESGYTYAVKQAAVWIVTDNASYEDTQILSDAITFRSLISEKDYAQAMELVEQAKNM